MACAAGRPGPPREPADLAAFAQGALKHAWDGYRKYAWGHDELRPVSRTPRDWYGETLLITPVDALDSLILLGLSGEAEEARAYIDANLSFDKDVEVKNFEIVIRVLGGLLSAYQLTSDARLLALADDLGRRLLPAFDSPTGMPYMKVNLRTGKVSGAKSNPAEIGTLLLELGTLARLSKNDVYFAKAKRALVEVFSRRSRAGLVADEIDVETGAWTSRESHIGGGIDSYYEYLLKAWLLFGDEDCRRMWTESIGPVNRFIADERPSGLWYGVSDFETGARLRPEYGALEAFFAGTLVLAGDLDRGACRSRISACGPRRARKPTSSTTRRCALYVRSGRCGPKSSNRRTTSRWQPANHAGLPWAAGSQRTSTRAARWTRATRSSTTSRAESRAI